METTWDFIVGAEAQRVLMQIDYGAHSAVKRREWSQEADYCWCCMEDWPCRPAVDMRVEALIQALNAHKEWCPDCMALG